MWQVMKILLLLYTNGNVSKKRIRILRYFTQLQATNFGPGSGQYPHHIPLQNINALYYVAKGSALMAITPSPILFSRGDSQ
jgi:hypothetical protein